MCSARTNQNYKKRVQEEETQSILYWFTTQGYVQSSLHCKENSTNSINCSHTINQPIPTPRRNQNPAKLIYCSPQPPINFSRNTRLIPIAQTSQFLLPVEIRNLLNWSTAPLSLQSISAENPRLTSIAQTSQFLLPVEIKNPANWSTAPRSFQSVSAENTGLLLKPKPVQTFNEFYRITMKTPQSWFKQDQEGFRKTPWLTQKERPVHNLEESQ